MADFSDLDKVFGVNRKSDFSDLDKVYGVTRGGETPSGGAPVSQEGHDFQQWAKSPEYQSMSPARRKAETIRRFKSLVPTDEVSETYGSDVLKEKAAGAVRVGGEAAGMVGGGALGGLAGTVGGLYTGPGAVATGTLGAVAGAGAGYSYGRDFAEGVNRIAGLPTLRSRPDRVSEMVEGAEGEMTGQVGGEMLPWIPRGANAVRNWLPTQRAAKGAVGKYLNRLKAAPRDIAGEAIRGPAVDQAIKDVESATGAPVQLTEGQRTGNPLIRGTEKGITGEATAEVAARGKKAIRLAGKAVDKEVPYLYNEPAADIVHREIRRTVEKEAVDNQAKVTASEARRAQAEAAQQQAVRGYEGKVVSEAQARHAAQAKAIEEQQSAAMENFKGALPKSLQGESTGAGVSETGRMGITSKAREYIRANILAPAKEWMKGPNGYGSELFKGLSPAGKDTPLSKFFATEGAPPLRLSRSADMEKVVKGERSGLEGGEPKTFDDLIAGVEPMTFEALRDLSSEAGRLERSLLKGAAPDREGARYFGELRRNAESTIEGMLGEGSKALDHYKIVRSLYKLQDSSGWAGFMGDLTGFGGGEYSGERLGGTEAAKSLLEPDNIADLVRVFGFKKAVESSNRATAQWGGKELVKQGQEASRQFTKPLIDDQLRRVYEEAAVGGNAESKGAEAIQKWLVKNRDTIEVAGLRDHYFKGVGKAATGVLRAQELTAGKLALPKALASLKADPAVVEGIKAAYPIPDVIKSSDLANTASRVLGGVKPNELYAHLDQLHKTSPQSVADFWKHLIGVTPDKQYQEGVRRLVAEGARDRVQKSGLNPFSEHPTGDEGAMRQILNNVFTPAQQKALTNFRYIYDAVEGHAPSINLEKGGDSLTNEEGATTAAVLSGVSHSYLAYRELVSAFRLMKHKFKNEMDKYLSNAVLDGAEAERLMAAVKRGDYESYLGKKLSELSRWGKSYQRLHDAVSPGETLKELGKMAGRRAVTTPAATAVSEGAKKMFGGEPPPGDQNASEN